jgi:predicted dehydrogenase
VTQLRLGIVGCGAVAERYHLPAVAACPDVRLVGLADPRRERAAELAEQYGAELVAVDAAELLGVIDAAIVATPNSLHAEAATVLARGGVHVLIEKPLARTAAECDAIADAVAAGGVVAAVGHDFRHFPVAQTARALLAGDIAGDVASAELLQSAGGNWPHTSADAFTRDRMGGGVLIDFGVHMLDLLGWWLGPLEVESYRDDAEGGVETECELRLRSASGADVLVELTRLRDMRDTTIVRGSRATVEIGIFEPALLRLTPLGGAGALSGDVPDLEFERAPIRTVFVRQLIDFVQAVRTGSPPAVSLADGRRAVELVERAYALRTPLRRAWDWPEAYA